VPISSDFSTVLSAILSMDAYSRGNDGLRKLLLPTTDTHIGAVELKLIEIPPANLNAGFFAQAYSLGGKTIISKGWIYRNSRGRLQ
jgi:hypothetical protein